MTNVNSVVENFLTKYNINEPPIKVEEIAKDKLNIIVVRRPYKSQNKLAAMLIRDEDSGKVIIALNGDHKKEKQRFSIAHEIGHFLLHPAEKLFVDREFSVDYRDSRTAIGKHIKEIEANRFAGNLLVPRRFLVEDLRNYLLKEKVDKIKISQELSKKYEVSTNTINIRINALLDELEKSSKIQ